MSGWEFVQDQLLCEQLKHSQAPSGTGLLRVPHACPSVMSENWSIGWEKSHECHFQVVINPIYFPCVQLRKIAAFLLFLLKILKPQLLFINVKFNENSFPKSLKTKLHMCLQGVTTFPTPDSSDPNPMAPINHSQVIIIYRVSCRNNLWPTHILGYW